MGSAIQGRTSRLKGVKFERRIKREIEYYGGIVVRCAASKPVDLLWVYNGVPVVIECKDVDSLNMAVTIDRLKEFVDAACCPGLLVWQDRYFMVRFILILPAAPPRVWYPFNTFPDVLNYIDSISKPIAKRIKSICSH